MYCCDQISLFWAAPLAGSSLRQPGLELSPQRNRLPRGLLSHSRFISFTNGIANILDTHKGYFLYLRRSLKGGNMGILTKLLGASPRVAVVEAFAENSDETLSVPEIVRITRVSKRAVYIHVRRLLKDGMLVVKERLGKCDYYQLNKTDPRGKAVVYLADVMAMGQLENEIRRDEGIELGQTFPLPRLFRPELFESPEEAVRSKKPSPSKIHAIYFTEPTALTWTNTEEHPDRKSMEEPIGPPTYRPFAVNVSSLTESGSSYECNTAVGSDEPCLSGQVIR